MGQALDRDGRVDRRVELVVAGQDQRRRVLVELEFLREELVVAIRSAEQKRTAAAAEVRALVELLALQSVTVMEAAKAM